MPQIVLRYTTSVAILLCCLSATFSQVPGSPSLEKVKPLQNLPEKNASLLSKELRQLASMSKTGEITTLGKTLPGGSRNYLDKIVQVVGGKVLIDATVAGDRDKAKQDLQKAGAKITGSYGRVISALIPVSALESLETSTQLRFVRPSYKPRHQRYNADETRAFTPGPLPAPPVTVYSQGDTAQGSYIARKQFKSDGKGVRVGILSDSYNNLGGADKGVLHDELPGPKNPANYKKSVKVLLDLDSGGIDEGRAMAEIIHDVAPGAEIAFHTAWLGQGAFAQGIVDLANAGCKIITDDIAYLDEPYFQDGIIAQAIDQVAKKGVTYFSAAGNMGAKSYESGYKATGFEAVGPGLGTAHNFAAPGAKPIYYQPIHVPPGGTFTIGFQWDDPFFSAGGLGAKTDMDIYIFDILGNPVAIGDFPNLLDGDPYEITGFNNYTTSNTFFISLVKYSGPDPSRLKYILWDQGSFFTDVPIPGQFAPTIVGHANSRGAIATGAAWYKTTPAFGVAIPVMEPYSSLGGTRIYFDKAGNRISPEIRLKPEITAPDGGNTSFFLADESADADSYPNFSGTSASAPHAAGVAALMIDAQKLNTITPDQIRGILSSRVYDMDNRYTAGFDKGFDYNSGHGLIRAEQAVGDVKFPNLYIKNLELVSLCSDDPARTRNWKIINPNPFDVKAHWFITGFGQDIKTTVAPGETYFSTNTAYFRNKPVPNIVILDWEDNFGFTRFDIAAATTNQCKNDIAGTQTLSVGEQVAILKQQKAAKPEIAEVFPNPSTTSFKLYLSLNKPGKADLTLYSEDGKLLYRNTVPGSGIYDIDASNYKSGLYLMKIRQGDFTRTLKLIKQ